MTVTWVSLDRQLQIIQRFCSLSLQCQIESPAKVDAGIIWLMLKELDRPSELRKRLVVAAQMTKYQSVLGNSPGIVGTELERTVDTVERLIVVTDVSKDDTALDEILGGGRMELKGAGG